MKPAKGMQMEGPVARWYTKVRTTDSQSAEKRREADQLTHGLPDGADVLEVAPGPGHLAIEMARLGRFRVTGMDSSHTFVEIASKQAEKVGVTVEFRQGDAADMPFPAESFDLIVTQAAFKNFSRPGQALDEMYRILRPDGRAVIQDMSGDASGSDIDGEVAGMGLSALNAWMTRLILRRLRRRAYSRTELERLVAASRFGTGDLHASGLSLEARLTRPIDPS